MATAERTKEILKGLHDAVTLFEEEESAKWAKAALAEGVDPFVAAMEGLAEGMMEAGEKYNKKEYFVPELLMCADALYAGLDILKPAIAASGRKSEVKGSIVLGVVEGDVHDIGKNLVKLMFEVAGWTVYDLGKDVPLDKFVEEMIKTDSQVVGISALMTTSMLSMPEVIKKHASHIQTMFLHSNEGFDSHPSAVGRGTQGILPGKRYASNITSLQDETNLNHFFKQHKDWDLF
jgi:dimethylamine corrinoid protein